jgi:membrane protease subunit HflK
MPWKEPGKGDKDPWKSGQQPPDLDEVFQNVNRRLKRIFGASGKRGGDSSQNSGGSSGLFSILVIVVLLWAAYDAVHIVDEAEQGVVLRFGKYNRILSPGINLTLPRPIETMYAVNVSEVREVSDRGNMLTEDENLVDFTYKVQYRVSDAQQFLFNVRDPEITVQQAAESALRESVGNNRLDEILEGARRQQVSVETRQVLQETLDRYEIGVIITQFNFEDVNVPPQVREAYSDVIRAREDRERFIEEARVHANSVIPEARGRAARIEQEAEGYKEATIALAVGEASRFGAVLAEYLQAPEVTRKRLYIQTLESVFARSNKVLIDARESGNILYLPLDQLGSERTNSSARQPIPPMVAPSDSGATDSETNRNARREGRQ